ncbi:trigger factor [Aureliella helgolandensis]|uniref:Trigger factor n=1 Tax=Aureliella helgolandensis TaxID=2527968 RepID=A0A518GDN7_9BACT|nr:trigger factor [Aureliella helgolandensis]QDV26703.1 Trigger factor [Aureliella helgolandensis]
MAATETEVEKLSGEDEGKLQFDVKVDVTSACERHVVVSIPQAEVLRYRSKAFDDVSPRAELPGFRAGKAPRRLVEAKFREQVDEQVKSSLIMDSLQLITEGDHFSAISEPNFDYEAVELPAEGDFKFEFRIEVRPDFETPEWKGLDLERPTCELTDQHVDDHLARTLARFVPASSVDDGATSGDIVLLNATFKHGDKILGSFEEESVNVRPNLAFGDAILSGFDKLIEGKKEGDTFSAKVTLTDSAAEEELRGKEVDAEFTVHEVRRVEIEEISPTMLDSLGFGDIGELRGFVRGELERQFDYHQQQSLRRQAVEKLTEGADWDMPESLVRRQTNRELQRLQLELQRSGFNQDQISSYMNASRQNARATTVRALREHFVLEKIAEDIELEPSAEDYDKEVALIAEQNDASPRSIRARLEKTGQMDAIRNQIIEREVIVRITAEGKVTDKEDLSFLKSDDDTSNIEFAIAGDFNDIPEAMHENDLPQIGAPKLPEAEKDE